MDDERSLQTCVDVRLYFYPRERKPLGRNIVVKLV